MRYIYALRSQEEQNNVDLLYYANEIKSVVCGYLSDEEKAYLTINRDSFEFSFSGCIARGKLQKMGKLLAKYEIGHCGFVRQKNKAYAFVSYDKTREDEQVLVELIDCSTLDFEGISRQSDIPEWVQTYRKLELCTSYISIEKAKNIFGELSKVTKGEELIFFVELKHRHILYSRLIDGEDITYSDRVEQKGNIKLMENICLVEHLYSEGIYQPNYIDFVEIKLISQIKDEKTESKLKLKIQPNIVSGYRIDVLNYNDEQLYNSEKMQEENILVDGKNKKYTFTVYNVGQALATSIGEKGEKPFFYFDYGIACRKNKHTLPLNAKLPISRDATILLSHIDEDHWCGFRINHEALKCRWIIPQKPSKALTKVLSSVYFNGGSIVLYRASGLNTFKIRGTNNYMIAGNAKSYINPKRIARTVHENGNAMCIFGENEGLDYKIVVSGDQYYDYQEKSCINNINLLVACHHGGKYSWSKKTNVPEPSISKNEIVYSYGLENTYKHPSKCEEYRKAGWNTEHHTPKDGDFLIDIKLKSNLKNIGKIDLLGNVFEI